MKEFEKVHYLYWGSERQVFPTILLLEIGIHDYPERCYVTSISQGGCYAKRFGWSCFFDKDYTPSCDSCLNSRIDLILEGESDNETVPTCEGCSDWWSNDVVNAQEEYPLPPSFDILDRRLRPPTVQLSFKMIKRSLDNLETWHNENSKTTGATNVLRCYLQLLCLGNNDQLHKSMRNNLSVEDTDIYPAILRRFDTLGIELGFFVLTVMHLFFLGIVKGSIKASNKMKLSNLGMNWWVSLYNKMQSQQRHVMTLSIDWCPIMDFSAKKDKPNTFGCKGWMSRHCLGYSRIFLFLYSFLDDKSDLDPPEQYYDAIASFRRLVVVLHCLLANAFSDTPASARRIDHLVRLFLSACLDFHEQGKGSDKDPFFLSCPNYHSLLNCFELINSFGSLRYLWEGLDEKFIKYIKNEISIMRRTSSQLKLLLEKVFCTSVLRDFNMDNPLQYVDKYNKRMDFKVYRTAGDRIKTPLDVLEIENVITGFIDFEDNFFICFTVGQNKPIQLYPINFDDRDGRWMLNLWYAHITLGDERIETYNRKSLHEMSKDHFMMLRHPDDSMLGMRTVICQSWRVRMDDGEMSLPMPHEEFLKIYHNDDDDAGSDSDSSSDRDKSDDDSCSET